MNKLVCELCGSHDIIKQDQFFVCQSCGCKYTTEEAKKIIIDVNVKTDSSERIKNLYELARRAKASNNYPDASRYYYDIVREVPDDWEAFFFSTFFKFQSAKIIEIENAAQSVTNSIEPTFKLINNNIPIENKPTVIDEVVTYIKQFSTVLSRASENFYAEHSSVSGVLEETKRRISAIAFLLETLALELQTQFNDDEKALNVYRHLVDLSHSGKWGYNKFYDSTIQIIIKADKMEKQLKERVMLAKVDEEINSTKLEGDAARIYRDLLVERGSLQLEKENVEKSAIVNPIAWFMVFVGIFVISICIYIIKLQESDFFTIALMLLGVLILIGTTAYLVAAWNAQKKLKTLDLKLTNINKRIGKFINNEESKE